MQYRRRGHNRVIIIVSLALCAVVTIIHHSAVKAGRIDPISSIARRFLLAPALFVETSAIHQSRVIPGSLFMGPRLARQNAALRAKISRLEMENASLREQADDNSRLRQMLDLSPRLPWDTRAAEVLSLKPTPLHDTALLGMPHAAKVKLQDVVIADNGDLIGQVTQVTGKTCDALLLTDPLSSVGARVVAVGRPQPGKAVVGICVGNRTRTLELIDLSGDADIQTGDQIVTSGLGGVYPPDIRIGSVTDVQVDSSRFLKTATVAPSADFDGLREVFLRQ